MRLLFFTDTHGNERYFQEIMQKSKDADILVCLGDFTIFENDIDKILRKLDSIGKPVIILHGNHETSSSVIAASNGLANIHFIHKTYAVFGDIVFFGFGGGGFVLSDQRFDIAAAVFMKEFEKMNGKKLIVVTHAPPYGTSLDDLGYHVGLKNITEFIRKYQPLMAVSGHIHETFGKEERIGKTLVFNPGPKGRIIDV